MANTTLRKGNQYPTFSTVGDISLSRGEIAASMFKEYGVRFYESQEYELKVFLARNPDGSFAAKTICISKPRQNGKSFGARFYAIWMAAVEGASVLYSAHHGTTVRKMFKEIRTFIESTPDFYTMLKPNGKGIYSAAGSEGFYFVDENGKDAGILEFQIRTNAGARGGTYQIIIVDEAQQLTASELEALKPVQIASGEADDVTSDPQMIYIGTPPGVKCPGTEFRRWHDEAHSGVETSIWWMEWAVEKCPTRKDKAELMELVYLTNPAMGYRIKEATMLDVIDSMSLDGFARECLGWWDKTETVAVHVFTPEAWNACATENPNRQGLVVYAVKFAPDGSTGTMAACHRPAEGVPFVYVVESRSLGRGIGWFVDTLAANAGKAAQIVIDGQSNAQTLVDRLLERGVSEQAIIKPKTAEAISAYSTLENAVKERAVTHYAQPALDVSATKSKKRTIGTRGGWGFASTEQADATLIEACALALWGALTTKRKPGRKAVVF